MVWGHGRHGASEALRLESTVPDLSFTSACIEAAPHLSQESLDLFTKLASPEDVSAPQSVNVSAVPG